MASVDQRQIQQEANALYERYGRALEAEHRGEYVAIFLDGRTVVGPQLTEVLDEARTTFGPGSFVFKVGERSVWKWR